MAEADAAGAGRAEAGRAEAEIAKVDAAEAGTAAEGGAPSAVDNPVIVRLAEDAWPVLRAVRLAALADAPASFGATLAGEQAHAEQHWRDTIRTGALFVALADGSPVGMVGGFPRLRDGACGLGAMWVTPALRGRGVADRLVAAVLAWARAGHNRRVDLWAPADNPRARRFYQRQGFEPTGVTRPFPNAPGGFITQMSLDLHLQPPIENS
jgi:GNAT superfamily N-acetyltransferase